MTRGLSGGSGSRHFGLIHFVLLGFVPRALSKGGGEGEEREKQVKSDGGNIQK
jgi:hypothetical protein